MSVIGRQHDQRAALTTQKGRNSTLMVARMLGVSPSGVREWIADGHLKARSREASGRLYWVINDTDILVFLRTYGAVRTLRPTTETWRYHVLRGRELFHQNHISRQQIADYMCIPHDH